MRHKLLPQNGIYHDQDEHHTSEYRSSDGSYECSYASSEEEYDDSIPSKVQRTYARDEAGKRISVRVTGRWMDEEDFEKYQAQLQAPRESKVSLTDTYKRKMLESSISALRVDTCKTPRQMRRTDAGQARAFFEHLPLQDGGLRTTCVCTAIVDSSFQPQCSSSELCAYCLCSLVKTKTFKNLGAGGGGKTNKKPKWTMIKDELMVGTQRFKVHSACNLAFQRVNFLTGFPLLKILGLHAYEASATGEIEEACDICSRSGGILYYYAINGGCCSFEPPSEDGWVAHVPCLYWLSQSGLLERSLSQRRQLDAEIGVGAIVQSLLSDMINKVVRRSMESQENTDPQSLEVYKMRNTPDLASSVYDSLYCRWRCSICSSQRGLAIRCSSVGCTVRCHYLCAASAEWFIFKLDACAPGFLCPEHALDAVSTDSTPQNNNNL